MTHIFSIPQSVGALWRKSRRTATMAAAGVAMVACSSSDLLEVQLDAITPVSAQSQAGALAQRAAAIRDFTLYFAFNVSAWSTSGLITDELINARGGFEGMDQRVLEELTIGVNPWGSFSGTHHSTNVAIRNLRAFLPADATRAQYIGHLQSLYGFSLVITGEMYCNGIPLSEIKADGTLYNDPKMYSNDEIYTMAITYFDSALTSLSATDAFRNMARIGKARALLNKGGAANVAAAAAVVRAGGDGAGSAAVASTYAYDVEYNRATGSGDNGIYAWIPASANMGVPKTPEGINGLDYANDPRVGNVYVRLGQDGTTPIYAPLVPWALTATSPVPLATGREARLIEAEADLFAGGSNWLSILNTIRSSSTYAALPALTDPGTPTSRVNLLMKERAMWMYLTVHRMGDLRRMIRQYGRAENTVFPTGAYFKGGVYGSGVNLVPSTQEHYNPAYEAAGGKCTNRDA